MCPRPQPTPRGPVEKPKKLGPGAPNSVNCYQTQAKIMSKNAKAKTSKPVKKSAKKAPAKPAKKKSSAKEPAIARTRAATATPARVMTRKKQGRSVVVGVIGSVTNDDIALRAYYIAEQRCNLGLPGDAQSDWLMAERELLG